MSFKRYLIALDMDGTLLRDDKTIDEETVAYLHHLNDLGHLIVLASGRPLRALEKYQDLLKITSPLVAYNGAFITSRHDEHFPTFQSSFDMENVKEIITDIGLENLDNIMLETPKDIWLLRDDDELNTFFWHQNLDITFGDPRLTLNEAPMTLILKSKLRSPEADKRILDAITKHDQYLGRFWHNSDYSEAYFAHVTKREGLQYVADYYNIPHENTIAFGDADNDLEMLAWAGIGVAMSNAIPEVQKYANRVSLDDNNNQGVMKTLKEIFKK